MMKSQGERRRERDREWWDLPLLIIVKLIIIIFSIRSSENLLIILYKFNQKQENGVKMSRKPLL